MSRWPSRLGERQTSASERAQPLHHSVMLHTIHFHVLSGLVDDRFSTNVAISWSFPGKGLFQDLVVARVVHLGLQRTFLG